MQIVIVIAIVGLLGVGVWWGADRNVVFIDRGEKLRTYSGAVGIADIAISFQYPRDWMVDVSQSNPEFIKILSPNQLDFVGKQYNEVAGFDQSKRPANEPPMYLRVVSTNEIPFFAQLIHLSRLGLAYPDKRERVDNFIPNTETLEANGNVAPGTFFITRYGQTIFEFYRPSDVNTETTFQSVINSFSIHDVPIVALTPEQANQYDFAYSDANYNLWLLNSQNEETNKVLKNNRVDTVYSWVSKKGRIVYRPIARTTSTEYEYLDFSEQKVQKLNDSFGEYNIYDLITTQRGAVVYSTDGHASNYEKDDYIFGSSVYMSNEDWNRSAETTNVRPGFISYSPDEKTVLVQTGNDYGDIDQQIRMIDLSRKLNSLIALGRSIKWLSNNEFIYLRIVPSERDGRNYLARYNIQSRTSIDLGPANIISFDLSSDNHVVTYVLNSENTHIDQVFQYKINNGRNTEIDSRCNGQILTLVSGTNDSFAFSCYSEDHIEYFIWSSQVLQPIPNNPRSIAYIE